ncbi:MAG: hypothetical protein WBP41_16935 [Saprospiraceae bacterium]
MSLQKIRLSTTHLDAHNERMSVGALRSMLQKSNEKIIPLGIEHDPRKSPAGRIIKTELVELEDGEFALDGIAEVFDSDIQDTIDVGDREIQLRQYFEGEFKVFTDRTFRNDESQALIKELSSILKNAETREEIKKALDPISILIIGGSFVFGGIANGFLGEIGADGYRALKTVLKKLFSKNNSRTEELLIFEWTLIKHDTSINVEVILTNPTAEDIDYILEDGLKDIDTLLEELFDNNLGFGKIVYEYKNKKMELNYALLKNGIPLVLRKINDR